MFYDQGDFQIRCEWGEKGASSLALISDVVIIVDVLSFSTSVEIVTARGAMVFPYRWRDASAAQFAREKDAVLAGHRGEGYSLSPSSLVDIAAGARLVLPSPNGSTLTLMCGGKPVLAGCLRNARVVAEAARRMGKRIAVIPAGERWEDGRLRPAVEDWLGAGAIVQGLEGTKSPEAEAAASSFQAARSRIGNVVLKCSSGRELIEKGFGKDVELAVQLDCSRCVPGLVDGAYVNRAGS